MDTPSVTQLSPVTGRGEVMHQAWTKILHDVRMTDIWTEVSFRNHEVILWIQIFKSEEMDMRRGRYWCHAAVKTRFWWALMDCEGLHPLYLISKTCMMGSAEPDVMRKPSGDQAWFIKADCVSLVSCFHPNACSSVCLNLTSNSRSCLPGALWTSNEMWNFFS